MSFFTHYWAGDTLAFQEQISHEGDPLDHIAGNLFKVRGVRDGDLIYVISFIQVVLRVVARLQVGQIVSEAEAYRIPEPDYDLWEADEHVISAPGSATSIHFDRVIPPDELRQIEFISPDGSIRVPKRNRHGRPDPQTFRGVREITGATAEMCEHSLRDEAID